MRELWPHRLTHTHTSPQNPWEKKLNYAAKGQRYRWISFFLKHVKSFLQKSLNPCIFSRVFRLHFLCFHARFWTFGHLGLYEGRARKICIRPVIFLKWPSSNMLWAIENRIYHIFLFYGETTISFQNFAINEFPIFRNLNRRSYTFFWVYGKTSICLNPWAVL